MTKYKIKFTWTTEDQNKFVEETKICIRILKIEEQEGKYCVDFTKLAGRWDTFNSHVKEIKNRLDFANDVSLENKSKD